MEFHEAANIFPMDEETLPELQGDIEANGQLVPIELYEGKILDGRRRYTACMNARIEPKYKTVKPDDPIAYVLSLNKHRRHLDLSQLSMVGARAKALYQAAAQKRMLAGKGADGSGGRGHKKNPVAKSPQGLGKSRDEVGVSVGVSGKSIDRASAVLEHGTPELIAAVDRGLMKVTAAAALAAEPHDVQREAAADPVAFKSRRRTRPETNGHPEPSNGEIKGVGIFKANEAINILSRIPKRDALRRAGLKRVAAWIRSELKTARSTPS